MSMRLMLRQSTRVVRAARTISWMTTVRARRPSRAARAHLDVVDVRVRDLNLELESRLTPHARGAMPGRGGGRCTYTGQGRPTPPFSPPARPRVHLVLKVELGPGEDRLQSPTRRPSRGRGRPGKNDGADRQ